jgi:CheY-like chemotaxis protein
MTMGNLLVVDDEVVNREIISEYMEEEGYELALCEDGDDAWGVLNSGRKFDAVILDRMMPRMDGMELLQKIKSSVDLESIPVIMQTAAAGLDQVTEGMSHGAYYYLTKPYDKAMLLAIVRAATEVSRRRQAMEARQRSYSGIVRLVHSSHIRVRTLEDAQAVAASFGSLAADSTTAAMGFLELLMNAIEHGNLGIDCNEKSRLLSQGNYEEELKKRMEASSNQGKYVDVYLQRGDDVIEVRVVDQGAGFDWKPYLTLDSRRALNPNGRGIALARTLAFESVEYLGKGNEVVVRTRLASDAK